MKSLNVSKECPRWMYEAFRALEANSRTASVGLQAIDRGEAPYSGGNPIAGVTDHGQLTGLVPDDDHTQYALLRGRTGGQTLYGTFPDDSSPTLLDANLGLTDKASRVTSSTSWTPVAIDTSAAAGTFVLAILSTNQNSVGFSTGSGGTSTFHSTITDTQSNTWVKLYEYSWQTQAGSDGMTVSVWYSKLTNALASGADTLTITFSGAIQSKTITARQFTGVNGSTMSVVQSAATGYTDINSVVIGSQALSSLATGTTYIALRALATHATTSTSGEPTFTPTSAYTSFPTTPANCSLIAPEGTSRNVCSRGEFQINNTSSFTSDPRYPNDVSQSQFVDSVSVFLALQVNAPNPTGDLTLQSVNQTGGARINLHNTDSYFYSDNFYFGTAAGSTKIFIRGSDGAIIGDTSTSDPGAGNYLYLLGFNNPPTTSTSVGGVAAEIILSTDAVVYADNFQVFERSTSYGPGQGFQVATGAGFANVTNFGKLTINGMASGSGVLFDHNAGGLTVVDVTIKKRASQTGDMTQWQDETGTVMSYIAAADGSFNGPIFSTGGTSSLLIKDTNFTIVDDGDTTKKLKFQVSAISPSTIRTITVLDVGATMLQSQGPDNGATGTPQVIGTTSHTHGGDHAIAASSLAIEGCVLLGNNIASAAFTTTRALDINHKISNAADIMKITADMSGITGSASGNMRMFFLQGTGNAGYTGGTMAGCYGFHFLNNIGTGSATVTDTAAGYLQTGATTNAVTNNALKATQIGSALTAVTSTSFGAIEAAVSNRNTTVTGILYGIRICKSSLASYLTPVAHAVAVEIGNADTGIQPFADDSDVVNWTGIKLTEVPTLPTGVIKALDIGNIPSVFAGKVMIGSTTVPTHYLMLGAGTTAIAPLVFTSGTSLTTPVAGAIEFTTDNFFATITTGTARKAFVLDDGARLTSGVIPLASTNGRLIDGPAPIRGDIVVAVSGPSWSKLALGQNGYSIVSDGSDVTWKNAPFVLSTTTGIDGSSAAATTVYTVPAGRKAIITHAIVRTTSYTSGNLTADLYTTSAGDIIASHTMASFTAADQYHEMLAKDGASAAAAAGTISFNVTGTGTMTVSVDLIGYLI